MTWIEITSALIIGIAVSILIMIAGLFIAGLIWGG